jgi:hypothetical protein
MVSIIILYYGIILYYYNLMGPPSYMRSVFDRNVFMRRMAVFELVLNTILDTLHRSFPEIHNSSKAKSASLVMRNGEREEPTLLKPLEVIFSVREL